MCVWGGLNPNQKRYQISLYEYLKAILLAIINRLLVYRLTYSNIHIWSMFQNSTIIQYFKVKVVLKNPMHVGLKDGQKFQYITRD